MAAEIINSGKNYITDNIKGNLPSHITRFILANVPHADPTVPVDMDETMPAVEQVVYNEAITRSSKISIDEVVFSQILMSNVGDFDFNWIGLGTDDDTLIAVAYVPLQYKRKYLDGQIGNSLTRNIVLKFANAADALGVHIAPETWQFDMLEVIQSEIQKAISGHEHNDEYYGQQYIDENFATKESTFSKAEAEAVFLKKSDLRGAKFNELTQASDAIALESLNIITATHEQTLIAAEDGAWFDVEVVSVVDLDAGDVRFLPPANEEINALGKKHDDYVRIVKKDQTFKFYRLNGEWYAS